MGTKNNKDKWSSVIGCIGLLNMETGYLHVFSNIKMYKQTRNTGLKAECRVLGTDKKAVYITFDGFNQSYIPKKFVKII